MAKEKANAKANRQADIPTRAGDAHADAGDGQVPPAGRRDGGDADVRRAIGGRMWTVLRGHGGNAWQFVARHTADQLPHELQSMSDALLAQPGVTSVRITYKDGTVLVISEEGHG